MIIFSEGGKGGVGKSLITGLVMYHYVSIGQNPVLIETDTSNPDTHKIHCDLFKTILCEIDTQDGWIAFLSHADENRDNPVVVNCGARNERSIKQWGSMIPMLGIPFKVLFTINSELDSVLLLKSYLETVDPRVVTVVKNGFFGQETDFRRYDNSKTREKINSHLYVPELLTLAATRYYSERTPIHKLAEVLNFGERLFFESWVKKLQTQFAVVLS
ncbi:MAG: hypothetical protein LBN33_03650 [Desulfovibrio sp.]|jgi:hypothetical protein|nr:hypothetical protein [Desulfovibrio sp.]